MNLIALSEFILDFVIPSAARNLLFDCAIARAQAAGRSLIPCPSPKGEGRWLSVKYRLSKRTIRHTLGCFFLHRPLRETMRDGHFMNLIALAGFIPRGSEESFGLLRYRARSSRWAFVIATGLESSAPIVFRTATQNLQGPLMR
jgi:hypothetical protein